MATTECPTCRTVSLSGSVTCRKCGIPTVPYDYTYHSRNAVTVAPAGCAAAGNTDSMPHGDHTFTPGRPR